MIEIISLYIIGVLSIFSIFLNLGIFGSEEEILQKITPWRKNQVIDFCIMVLFSNIYGIIFTKKKTDIERHFVRTWDLS